MALGPETRQRSGPAGSNRPTPRSGASRDSPIEIPSGDERPVWTGSNQEATTCCCGAHPSRNKARIRWWALRRHVSCWGWRSALPNGRSR
ncbi:hypothetical protein VTK56DRAFT_3253 [Thermocarpiscus australiensis]